MIVNCDQVFFFMLLLHCIVFRKFHVTDSQNMHDQITSDRGRNPFHQNFRKFWSKTQWIGSVQPEKFRKNWSSFWRGPLFPVGPVGILVEWIALRRSKHAWSNCVLCIPFILSRSPNECWLHTNDERVITTWRLGLQVTRGASKNALSNRNIVITLA